MRLQLYWTRVKIARDDPNEFMELVLRDEETGKPIQQAPLHEEFQQLATAEDRLLVWGHIESGKTQQLAIGRTLFELGRNPRLRYVIGSAGAKYSATLVSTIKRYIERPGPIHDIFPKLRPGPKWTDSTLVVDLPGKSIQKDPTIQATSLASAGITGSRTDRLLLDDLLNLKNTANPTGREEALKWYRGVTRSRLTPDARVIWLGNAFHPEDAMHVLSQGGGFAWKKFPVVSPDGQLTWPDRWPRKRIETARVEFGPHEFARQLLCIPRDESSARFRREWIDACLKRGEGRKPAFALTEVPAGYRTYTGVDLGVRRTNKSDLTVLFTIVVHPDESREVIWIESGRWAAKEIVSKIVDTHNRYGSIVIVENNQAQQFIVDFTKSESAVPVRPFFTGSNKAHPAFGVESLATEMANGKWIIPSVNGRPATKELDAWVTEMLYYDPNAHTGDRLMASWFAREGSRHKRSRARVGRNTLMAR